jgi:hypothetical protein
MGYSRSDVQTHRVGYTYTRCPAVNVKWYGFNSKWMKKLEEHFQIKDKDGEKRLEKALEYWQNSASEQFWDWAREDLLEYAFGKYHGLKVYSEGRSGGWLIVQGLPDLETWDAVQLGKWHRFEKQIRLSLDYWNTEEGVNQIIEDIEANRWIEAGAEQYNFMNRPDGGVVCLVDLKRVETEARERFLTTPPKEKVVFEFAEDQ